MAVFTATVSFPARKETSSGQPWKDKEIEAATDQKTSAVRVASVFQANKLDFVLSII